MSLQEDDWLPLSVRTGRRERTDLHEGIPTHLLAPLRYWIEGELGYRSRPVGGRDTMNTNLMLRIGTMISVSLPLTNDAVKRMNALIGEGERNTETYLDLLDALLRCTRGSNDQLEAILRDGRSAWKVAPGGSSLVRRVDPSVQTSADLAMSPNDLASAELVEAWDRVYGRHADASDAWDHAIKAVEAMTIPIVVPNHAKATLGNVIGELGKTNTPFTFGLGGKAGLDTFVSVLSLIWPNPDRHGNGNGRQPTETEGRAVLALAVTVVQWLRDGLLVRAAR
jgi:hypothetical protein